MNQARALTATPTQTADPAHDLDLIVASPKDYVDSDIRARVESEYNIIQWGAKPSSATPPTSAPRPAEGKVATSDEGIVLKDLAIPPAPYTDSMPSPTFKTFAMWDGRVLSIGPESFIARLTSKTESQKDEEDAEFPLTDIEEDDKELFKEGAHFLFLVGYAIDSFGTHTRGSQIRFERLPAWTEDETLDAYEKAKPLSEFFRP